MNKYLSPRQAQKQRQRAREAERALKMLFHAAFVTEPPCRIHHIRRSRA